jgi:hypothetical protein
MAIDPSIAMSYRGIELPDPIAQYGQIAQIKNAQNQNALAQYQLGAAQRQEATQNVLSEAYAKSVDPTTGKIDYNKLTGLVAAGGGGAQLPGIEKTRREMETAEAQRKKQEFDLKDAQAKFIDQAKRNLSRNPSDDNVKAWGQDSVIDGIFTPEQADRTVQELLKLAPQDRAQLLSQAGASAADMRPVSVAPGASLVGRDNKVLYTAPERQDTDLIRNFNAAKAQGFAGNIFDYERKIKEAGRTPAQASAPSITQIVDPTNPNQMIMIDARRYQGGSVGAPGVLGVGGKEPGAALRMNKVEEGKTQLANDLDNLRSSFTELDRLRAIPSTERNVASNLMAAAQATGVGQALGRAGGTKEQVERDVINSARQRLVASIKNATGMSSKSLDSNMELQTMLRSISDPGQSVEAALRIIGDIEDAYVKGDGQLPKGNRVAPAAQGTGGFKYLGKESK